MIREASSAGMRLLLFGIAAMVAIAGGAVGWWAHAPASGPASPSPVRAESPDQTASSDQIRVQQAIADIRRVQPEESAVAMAEKVAMSPQEILKKGNEATQRRIGQLDAWYYSMPANSRWANSSKKDVDTLVNTDIPQLSQLVPRTYKSDCRDHVCRMEASLDGATAEDWADIVNAGLSQSLPRTHMLMLHNSDGSTTVVMYAMARGVDAHL